MHLYDIFRFSTNDAIVKVKDTMAKPFDYTIFIFLTLSIAKSYYTAYIRVLSKLHSRNTFRDFSTMLLYKTFVIK